MTIQHKKKRNEVFLKRHGMETVVWTCDSCEDINDCRSAYELFNHSGDCIEGKKRKKPSREPDLDDIQENMKEWFI